MPELEQGCQGRGVGTSEGEPQWATARESKLAAPSARFLALPRNAVPRRWQRPLPAGSKATPY